MKCKTCGNEKEDNFWEYCPFCGAPFQYHSNLRRRKTSGGKKMPTYTVFVKSAYWKSFSNKAKAQAEASKLRKDGATRVRVSKK